MLAVKLDFTDGTTRFLDDVHVHGLKDNHLLLATGQPGSGLDAEVVFTLPLAGLRRVETCERSLYDDEEDADDDGSGTFSIRL